MKQFDPTHRHLSERTERECLRRDHRVKIWLLLVSLGTMVVLVGAALIENVFSPWRQVQLEYRALLEERATDDWGRQLAANYTIGMRQIVVPELEVMDRCVTCHNGIDDPRMHDVPQPHTVHPGPYLQWHDANRFGCTICHRGQGRATTFADAKGDDRHWDYPLLPSELTESSCGVCHSAVEVAGRGGDLLATGQALFEAKGCRGCHALEGRGGNAGPALDGEGLKVRGELPFTHVDGPHTLPQWLMEHFDDPRRVVAGSEMPTPGLSRQENSALTTYMLSLQDKDLPSSYLSPERHLLRYKAAHPEERSGEELYRTFCRVCHDDGRFGRWDRFFARFIPAIRGEDYRRVAEPRYVAANIRHGRPGTIMPAWGPRAGGLAEPEIARIVGYLLGRPVAGREIEDTPLQLANERPGDAARGGALFLKNCSGCHGPDARGGIAPALDTRPIQEFASDVFLRATISRGRRNTAMPAFLDGDRRGLDGGSIEDIVAFLRSLARGEAESEAMAALPTTEPDHGGQPAPRTEARSMR